MARSMAILPMALVIFPFSLSPPWYADDDLAALTAFSLASVILLLSWDLVPPADGIYSLMAFFVFRIGHSADDRSSPSSGYIPAGHEQFVLWPFRNWL